MHVSSTIWLITIALILVLVAVDLLTASRKPRDIKFGEASMWTLFYVGIALLFGLWIWNRFGSVFGTEFFAAYLVEYSLSIDNLFIFVIILAQFAVPNRNHQRVLLIGVILALVFRAIFIAICCRDRGVLLSSGFELTRGRERGWWN